MIQSKKHLHLNNNSTLALADLKKKTGADSSTKKQPVHGGERNGEKAERPSAAPPLVILTQIQH